jgi:lysophospholipase L1-like esterase
MTRNPTAAGAPGRSRILASVILINVAILCALLIPVELIFGTWIRPLGLSDLKRFSIPISVTFAFDTSSLYEGGSITYTRDEYGLRGQYPSLAAIDLLTIGGSTTDQRYLDDGATWQAAAGHQLQESGTPLVIANAGVDGQSTVGHAFNFDNWFPLLPALRPRVVLFYLGANDVLRHEERVAYDGSLDATSWRVRSATFQLFRTVRSNMRARDTRVAHGRMPSSSDFTEHGLLPEAERAEISAGVTAAFLANVEGLRERAAALGAQPIFMTQTAFGWNADRFKPRGLSGTVVISGRKVNYADVAAFHQGLNRGLMEYCSARAVTCFDLANDVTFEMGDYYDYLHNTPSGADKIGRYVAARVAAIDIPSRAGR